jgi:hypothetical protein
MSQVDVATKSSAIQQRTAGMRSRAEDFVRSFEWNWTNSVLFSMAMVFFILISTSIMPSFWIYFAEQTLDWKGPTDIESALNEVPTLLPGGDPAEYEELLLQLRDAIAMGLSTIPLVVLFVVSSALQNWRKKLRGGVGEGRPAGGYR